MKRVYIQARRTLRTQIFATALVSALALAAILGLGALADHRVTNQIDTIRSKFVPKLGLGNRLETAFERISRQLQNAADASDVELVDEARRLENQLLATLDADRPILDPSLAVPARAAVDAYYRRADNVTRRMIAGEAGDAIVHDAEAMQREQARASDLLARAAAVDEDTLAAAFADVVAAERTSARQRLTVSTIGLGLVLLLSVWVSRRVSRGLGDLALGFQRFGAGSLDTPIPISRDDELGLVARDANQMAEHLRQLLDDRDRTDWIKAGQVGLADALRGELDPDEVAQRAIAFIARHLGAPLGIVYVVEDDSVLRPLAGYGVPMDGTPSFCLGEGLVGEAATRSELTVMRAPPGRLPIRSGLTDGDAHMLVLVPLAVAERTIGVVELAALEWRPREEELVSAIRDLFAAALDGARGRSATRALLAETQHQAAALLVARRGIEQKAAELARASAYKSQFLANMSHELRTPLNAIIGFSEMMVDGAIPLDSDQAKEFVGDIVTSGRHLLQLINDVLDLSKVEAGKLEFTPAATRLSTAAREVLAILRTQVARKRLDIAVEIDDAIDEVTLDTGRLKQVLYNYLSNALKFTPDGGRITVRAMPASIGDRPSFRLEVEDTGPGISEADTPRLFVEFQQTEHGARQGTGTGLGLALTKRLVEAQGGRVGVISEIGKGSVFFAELPRETAAPIGPSPPPARSMPRAGARSTILVVEDDPRDREQLSAALETAGYAVEAVGNGNDAIACLSARTYDAITLDLLLPDMTGIEVLEALRTTPNQHVPVVLVTVVAEHGAVAGFAVHDILAKPLDQRALLASLARAGIRAGCNRRVLVVDDDPTSLKVIGAMLRRLGFEAVCEQNSVAGLEKATAVGPEAPSAIVLDLIMPTLGGFEFLDRLRADPAGRGVPVIVWTSKDLTHEERLSLRRSADAVVAKGRDGNSRVISELEALLPTRGAA